jgi:hypothetical protein
MMDKKLLQNTKRNLYDWLTKCRHETVHLDKRMEIIMMALADMCEAMATDKETEDDTRKTIPSDTV